MKLRWIARCLLAMSTGIALLASVGMPVEAAGPVRWQTPDCLTSENAVVQYSEIIADPYGGVHAFWTHMPESDEPANLIFYCYLDSSGRTEPLDLFSGEEGETLAWPSAHVDANGRLHLAWTGTRGVYYTSVPADQALDRRHWSTPELIVGAIGMGRADLLVDDAGSIHLVYTVRSPGTNVMYMRSEDDGDTWTLPAAISAVLPSQGQTPDSVRLALDSEGGLHIVWAENHPPAYIGRQVFYSHSIDGGSTWAQPYALSELSVGDAWNGPIAVAVDSTDSIHVVWACGSPVQRCYRHSSDRGHTWSTSVGLFDGLIGLSGWDAFAADPYGNLYWASGLRYPQALYFASVTDGTWPELPLPLVSEGTYGRLSSGHWPEIALSQGSQIHMVIVESDGGPLWHLQGDTGLVSMTPVPLRVPTKPLAVDVPATAAITQTPDLAGGAPAPVPGQPAPATGSAPLALGSLSALVVMLAVVAIARRRRPG